MSPFFQIIQMTAAVVASQTYQDRINGEVLRVVIIDPDWMIRCTPTCEIDPVALLFQQCHLTLPAPGGGLQPYQIRARG
jgi:hypothetical protein